MGFMSKVAGCLWSRVAVQPCFLYVCFKSVGWCGRDQENLLESLCSSHWQQQDCKIRIARNICLTCAFSKEPFFAWHSWQKQIFNMQFAVSAKLYCMILKISNDVDRCRWLQNGCPIFKQLSLIITWYHSYAPDQGSTHCHSKQIGWLAAMPWQRVLASARAALGAQHGDKRKGELYLNIFLMEEIPNNHLGWC